MAHYPRQRKNEFQGAFNFEPLSLAHPVIFHPLGQPAPWRRRDPDADVAGLHPVERRHVLRREREGSSMPGATISATVARQSGLRGKERGGDE